MSSEVAVGMQGGRWKRYPAYRDSGVEWIGEVPEGWEIIRLKYCSRINMGQSPSSEDCNINGIGLPFLQGNAEFSAVNPIPKQYCEVARKVSHKGDLLISVRAPVGALNIADQDYGIGRGLCGITTNDPNFNSTFCWYLLHHVRVQLNMNATGSTYDAVSADDIGNMVIVFPPLPEQRAIAAFLDRETGRIDALIEKKERQIELLQEKRAALISHAVTKGLDPDVKMKDSGVEWIGEVPEGWEVKRLKYISTVNDETLSETTDLDYELLYVDISSVDPVSGIKNKEPMTFENAPSRARRKVRHGDVIISTVRTYLRAISPINFPEPNMIVSTGFAVIHPKEGMESQFAAYTLHAPYFVERVVANSVGVSYPAINASELITINIALPPLPEQRAIAAFLDRETGRIDTLTTKIRESISKLHEYRTALISAAVTGKIDVREGV